MSRAKPKNKYITTVVKIGNGARIRAFKQHIGREVEVRVKPLTDKEYSAYAKQQVKKMEALEDKRVV